MSAADTTSAKMSFRPIGVIFDVDDTLLDNQCNEPPYHGLHERSRHAAIVAVGKRRGIKVLEQFNVQDNVKAFLTSPVHTLDGAVWNAMCMTGVASGQMDAHNPILQEIVDLKNSLHGDVLRKNGREFPGAAAFVRGLADAGLADKFAIASTAVRRDINLSLEIMGLTEYFPAKAIISRETITCPKPHPQAFDMAFRTLGLPDADRKRVCAFEDDPRGVASAQAAGLYVCVITTRYDAAFWSALKTPPDLVADSYEEFARIFGFDLASVEKSRKSDKL